MLGSRLISTAIKLTTGVKINDPTSGMRLYSRKCIKEFAQEINYGPEPDTISYLIKNGAKVAECRLKVEGACCRNKLFEFCKIHFLYV